MVSLHYNATYKVAGKAAAPDLATAVDVAALDPAIISSSCCIELINLGIAKRRVVISQDANYPVSKYKEKRNLM